MSADVMATSGLSQENGGPFPDFRTYPAPAFFQRSFDVTPYLQHLRQGRIGGLSAPLALYLHALPLPNVHGSHTSDFADALAKEIGVMAETLENAPARVERLHCEASTDFLPELAGVLHQLQKCLLPQHAHSLEMDLHADDTQQSDIGELAALGFTHINLKLTREALEDAPGLVSAVRSSGIKSASIELLDTASVHGLPLSPGQRDLLISCGADQLKFNQESAFTRQQTLRRMRNAGYVKLGADSYARLGSSAAAAKKRDMISWEAGRIYPHKGCDTIAIGPGGISRIGSVYVQNASDLALYRQALDAGKLPVNRGMLLSTDDLIRRSVIEALLCHEKVNLRFMAIAYLIHWEQYFARELFALEQFILDGLVEREQEWIILTSRGCHSVEKICKAFDRYPEENPGRS